MNSIAIWYEKTSDEIISPNPGLDIHINHWKLKPNRSSVNSQFMDIGLLLKAIYIASIFSGFTYIAGAQ